jgi:hypothetical protein
LAIQKLKWTITEEPILQHFNPAKLVILHTDTSESAIEGILNQYDGFGVLRPVNLYCQKFSSAKHNYDTFDWELLAIVETLKQW